jgi:hypothetical protein
MLAIGLISTKQNNIEDFVAEGVFHNILSV